MRAVLVLLVSSWVFVGCGEASEGAEPEVGAAAPVELGVFSQEGLPGPWTRQGANRDEFVADSMSCRTRSSDARSAADSDDRSEVAYRVFLECMQELRWTRGFRPVDMPPAPAA